MDNTYTLNTKFPKREIETNICLLTCLRPLIWDLSLTTEMDWELERRRNQGKLAVTNPNLKTRRNSASFAIEFCMKIFIILRQPVSISVTVFSNHIKLTNYLFIFPIKIFFGDQFYARNCICKCSGVKAQFPFGILVQGETLELPIDVEALPIPRVVVGSQCINASGKGIL